MKPTPGNCARCGRPMEPGVAGTLCPDCRQALLDEPLPSATEERPPRLEALAGHDSSAVTSPPDRGDTAQRTIGTYRILSLIAEGGMGSVFLAEQQTPHRRVALKVIKAGMDTRQVVARFETEREALAMMDHPNIATVFDAGETEAGRPYFVMEYVGGVPITDYCDRHQLRTHDRLSLFLQVCGAIQHAHQKGVIHRDIKPSNVLVTVVEGVAVPKVIDFGVAKATNRRLTEKTLFTEFGLLVGTPEYMSPEQAEMTGLDVDTTTDIYALGVLLYELLVGALPFDSARLRRAGYAEIQRIIREEEPARPSTRLSSLGATATDVARRRQTDLPSLMREVRGDLDWITLKAMEKDRTRRYASASEFAADLHRHIANEPVVARPANVGYRARKFIRRHRVGVAVGAAAVLVLVVFGATMAVQSARLSAQRDVANRERERAERISSFLISLFEESDPNRSKGEKVSARQILDRGRDRLESELKDQPQTRAALLHTIGSVYGALDLNDLAAGVLLQAYELRKSATGKDRADLADTIGALARIYQGRGDLARAEPMDQEVLRLRREVFGPEHVKVAHAINNLGIAAFNRGRYDDAEQYFRQAADMAGRVGSHTDAAQMQNGIGIALSRQGRLQEAVDVMRESTRAFERALGPEHTRTQRAMNNLANTLSRLGQYEEAEKFQRETLRVNRKLLGPENFSVAMSLYNLGSTLEGLGRFKEAERALAESASIYTKVRREPHSETAWALAGLGSVQLNLRQYDQAEHSYRAAVETFERVPNTPGNAAYAWDGLGQVLHARGQIGEAEKAFRRAFEIRQKAGDKSHGLAESQAMLAKIECERGSPDVGERLAKESVDSRRSVKEPHPIGVAFAESVLGRCHAARGRFEEGEVLLTKAHETLARRGPTYASRYAALSLAVLYDGWKKPEKAAAWRVRAQ